MSWNLPPCHRESLYQDPFTTTVTVQLFLYGGLSGDATHSLAAILEVLAFGSTGCEYLIVSHERIHVCAVLFSCFDHIGLLATWPRSPVLWLNPFNTGQTHKACTISKDSFNHSLKCNFHRLLIAFFFWCCFFALVQAVTWLQWFFSVHCDVSVGSSCRCNRECMGLQPSMMLNFSPSLTVYSCSSDPVVKSGTVTLAHGYLCSCGYQCWTTTFHELHHHRMWHSPPPPGIFSW